MTMLSNEATPVEEVKEIKALTDREKQQLSQKERTLFCINIDQRATEEILYELFLQAGPIENVIRKPDRNGKLFSLITYKYIESCDYAIKLFNGINIFNQSLKVQQSVPNSGNAAQQFVPPPPNHYQQQMQQPQYQQQNRARHQSMDPRAMMPNSLNNNQQGLPLMQHPAVQLANLMVNSFNPYPDLQNFRNDNESGAGGGHQSRRNNYNEQRHNGNTYNRSNTYAGNSNSRNYDNSNNNNGRDFNNQQRNQQHDYNSHHHSNSLNKRRSSRSRSPSNDKRRRNR